MNKNHGNIEYVCCIYATAPFEPNYIKDGLKITDEKANFFSVTTFLSQFNEQSKSAN